MNPIYFHRFLGHQLGPNSSAISTAYHLRGAEIGYQYSERGAIPIFIRGFSQAVPKLKEYRHTFSLRYRGSFWNDKVRLKAAYFFSMANNFHQTPGLHKTFQQFWLAVDFSLFRYNW